MKMVTWNVAGLRACIRKGFLDFMDEGDYDMILLQEVKTYYNQVPFDLSYNGKYKVYWNPCSKAGYCGVAILTKDTPENSYSFNIDKTGYKEGRVIVLEYSKFYLLSVYTPNSGAGLYKIDYRLEWENKFSSMIGELSSKKPVIIGGDLNVATNSIDLARPSQNEGSAGYSFEEREAINNLKKRNNLVDAFRYLYPNREHCYSYWSYVFNNRERNVGWRLDYFLLSESLKSNIKDCYMLRDVYGSDHCPVALDIDMISIN